MKLKKLTIKNYKSIEELQIEDFRNLNVFIGKNDAGKSNIIRALDILFNSNLYSYDQHPIVEEEDLLATTYKGSSEYHFYNKEKHEAEITAHLKLTPYELEKLGLEGEEELVLSNKVSTEDDHTKINLQFLRAGKHILVKTPDEKKRFLTANGDYTDQEDNATVKQFLESLSNRFIVIPADRNIIRDPHPQSEKVKVDAYIHDSLIELANSEEEDKKRLYEQFTEFITHLSPLIDHVEIEESEGKVARVNFLDTHKKKIPLSTIGGGNNELLLLLHEIIMSGGRILAIEEPEIHLHPEAERKLLKLMQEFSEATQMLLVTHSPVFVEPENLRGLYRVVKEKQKTEIKTMKKEDYIDSDRLEQELNSENTEMFFADKVLLVEGISDKIFMEGLIEKYCKSTAEIKVVASFSKDNFEVYIKLLKIFDIPYLVMTDLDSLKGKFKISIIWNEIKGKHLKNKRERIAFLRERGIHVLSKGALEQSYPSKYRRGESKPLDALYAVHNLTDEEYNSDKMKDIRRVIQALED